MKRYIAIGLCVVFVLGMVACGNQAQEPPEQSQEVQRTEPPATEPSVEPTATPIEVKQEVPQQVETKPVESNEPEETSPVDTSVEAGGDGEVTPEPEVDPFTEVNEQIWATSGVNLRSGPGVGYDKVGSMSKGQQAARTGIGIDEAEGWGRIQLLNGDIVCVSSSYISTTHVQQSTNNGGSITTTSGQTQTQTDGTTGSQSTTQPSGSTGSLWQGRKSCVKEGLQQSRGDE